MEEESYVLVSQGPGHRLGVVSTPGSPEAFELLLCLPMMPDQAEGVRLLQKLLGIGYELKFGEGGWVSAVRKVDDKEMDARTIRGLMGEAGLK